MHMSGVKANGSAVWLRVSIASIPSHTQLVRIQPALEVQATKQALSNGSPAVLSSTGGEVR